MASTTTGWRSPGASSPFLALGVLVMVIGATACIAAPREPTGRDGPRLSFGQREHTISLLNAGQVMEYRVAFTNTGNRPLQIDEVRLEPASRPDTSMPDCT